MDAEDTIPVAPQLGRYTLHIFLVRGPNPTYLNHNASSYSTTRLKSKLSNLKEERENGRIVCYHCGDLGHISLACHNLIVCFTYGKVEHHSWQC
jgi:hypothetical protein